jgi:uncharacterized protein (TIGR02452 family)
MDNISAWISVQAQFRDYVPMVPATKVFYKDHDLPNPPMHPSTLIRVIKGDTLDVARTIPYERPLVLILADAHVPGGCVGAGAGMQEESLFRRSALHKHLVPLLYPIEENAAIYCPHVELMDGTYMDFIACPGIKMPKLTDGNRLYPADEERLRRKLHVVFRKAYEGNHDTLVLGALGCGVWGCPPIHVAEIFKGVIAEYNGVFEAVYFAVLGANYNFFSSILDP